jgi:hypothetical protein
VKQILLSSALFVFLVSCAVKPPDVPICRELKTQNESKTIPDIGFIKIERPNPVCLKELNEVSCGFCVWTISKKSQYIGETKSFLYGKPWSQVKREAVLIPTEAYADVKATFINMCKKYKECAADISSWRLKLDSLDSADIWRN